MKTIKKGTLILALLFMGAITANAQSNIDGLKFGIKGGANLAKLKNVDSKAKIGLVAGVFTEYGFSDKFSLRSEVLFSVQGAKAKGSSEKVKLNYINALPALIKFYPVKKFSLEAGPQIGLLISKKGGGLLKSDYRKLDYGLTLGAGFHIIENIEIGARYYLGLRDITKTPGEVKNAVFQFTLSYGF
ncbi:porin family protein [Aquimarina celericrescens]|uniref:Porin family protein n=1 Tax=Aquimarina celericrescens TaxID=1964542 RepID=A0ABW5B2N8_9FLAO|nr:PorT family protein [Aquimarina celericrescens]